MDRRDFLGKLATVTAASGAMMTTVAARSEPQPAAATLPTIALGKYRVTRLVVGSNPINGYSYMGQHTDRHMVEYFTVERTVEFLLNCERAGINTHQFSTSGLDKAVTIFRTARERGSKMHLICLANQREELKDITEKIQPIAFVHHGGATDRLFSQGKGQQVHDFVKAAHDHGVLAGVSAHNPDGIRTVADGGWEVDFFMTCFYFVTRKSFAKPGQQPAEAPTLDVAYPFYRNDPAVMTSVVRQVKQPCLGFKILAAGRMCASQDMVRGAFEFAYKNIKPSDGVIVGMYPRFFDEIAANAGYARQYGAAGTGMTRGHH